MDPGQGCLAANAGQGFDSEPIMVWYVLVCEKHTELGFDIQYLSRVANVNN